MSEEELESILQNNKYVIIKFGASWCGPCKTIAPILEKIKKEHSDIEVISLDVDAEEELTEHFNIRNVPTLLFYADNKFIVRKVGVLTEERILSIFNN